MITALFIALISVLYILGIMLLLFIEFGLIIVLLFWPILLPVAIGWKVVFAVLWVAILLLFSSD